MLDLVIVDLVDLVTTGGSQWQLGNTWLGDIWQVIILVSAQETKTEAKATHDFKGWIWPWEHHLWKLKVITHHWI